MDIFNVLTMLGGLCLFLFGMNIMGQALERRAGDKLRLLLGKLTTGKAAGLLIGPGVTAVIQSSSAVTVMVVGFVNSGLMTLLPEIAATLGISVEEIYGISKEPEKAPVSADDFPSLCHKKLIDLFYYNTKMRFTHIESSDKVQLDYQIQKLMDGCRNGCISNTHGAIVVTDDFSFIDCSYKAESSETVIKSQGVDDYTLMYLTDPNLRKVFYYQYKAAFEKSKANNSEFTFDEIMNGCNLTEDETTAALRLLKECHINEVYTDRVTKRKKYVFLISNALYAHAIYKLVGLLSEDPVWNVLRDTSMISDYAFEK